MLAKWVLEAVRVEGALLEAMYRATSAVKLALYVLYPLYTDPETVVRRSWNKNT